MSIEGAYLKFPSASAAAAATTRINSRKDRMPEGVTVHQAGNLILFNGTKDSLKGLIPILTEIAKVGPMSRQTDAYRHTPLYEQLLRQGNAGGRLPTNPTPEQVGIYFEDLRTLGSLQGHPNKFIGDDLCQNDLDALWAVFAGEPNPESSIPGWWEDKPHQLAYRLLLRLTRAEADRDAALNLLAVMHGDGGHHTEEVGFVQSCKDAEDIRHALVLNQAPKDTP